MTVLIRRSGWLLVYLIITHFLAIFTVWIIPTGTLLRSVLSALVLLGLVLLCRRHQWLSNHKSLIKLRFDKENNCFLELSDKSKKGPYKIKGSVLFNPALVLYLQPVHGRLSKSIFIARDAVDATVWRQLRVKLRDPDSWDV